jgi:hypothetical protein
MYLIARNVKYDEELRILIAKSKVHSANKSLESCNQAVSWD